jgi:hypothetical protein
VDIIIKLVNFFKGRIFIMVDFSKLTDQVNAAVANLNAAAAKLEATAEALANAEAVAAELAVAKQDLADAQTQVDTLDGALEAANAAIAPVLNPAT